MIKFCNFIEIILKFFTISCQHNWQVIVLEFAILDLRLLFLYSTHEERNGIATWQVNEEASDKVLEVEQKYNEIRRPVYLRRNDIIKTIPDFWLTAVSIPSSFKGLCLWILLKAN